MMGNNNRRLGVSKSTTRAGQTKKVRMKRTPVAKEPVSKTKRKHQERV